MKPLSDAAVARLREAVDRPDAGDRYEIHELLGRGGMGAVYRATDRILRREVALKVLTIELDESGLARRLEREARVLARLEHPGIIAIHDAGVLSDGRPFYVMRLVRGRRFDELARATSRGEILRHFLSVCDAVSFAHSRGVIHRDLKPGNVMVGEFGEVLVLDWGVAKIADGAEEERGMIESRGGASTGDGVAVGTPGFMAPEQRESASSIDGRADVYGLGAMLSELLGDAATTPAPLKAIVSRATASDVALRYQTVEELAADVRAWLDAAAVSAYSESLLERGARFYRRNNALILLLLAYLVVRLFILWWRGV
jgi:serine/threonine protein kinase